MEPFSVTQPFLTAETAAATSRTALAEEVAASELALLSSSLAAETVSELTSLEALTASEVALLFVLTWVATVLLFMLASAEVAVSLHLSPLAELVETDTACELTLLSALVVSAEATLTELALTALVVEA